VSANLGGCPNAPLRACGLISCGLAWDHSLLDPCRYPGSFQHFVESMIWNPINLKETVFQRFFNGFSREIKFPFSGRLPDANRESCMPVTVAGEEEHVQAHGAEDRDGLHRFGTEHVLDEERAHQPSVDSSASRNRRNALQVLQTCSIFPTIRLADQITSHQCVTGSRVAARV
jgi:hypothetical protein